jgi:hypothetical protein
MFRTRENHSLRSELAAVSRRHQRGDLRRQVGLRETLGQQVPASFYRPSLRAYPPYLPHMQYPTHFEVRQAYPNGVISFGTTRWYMSICVAGERVGLEPLADGRWRVHCGWIPLGLLDPHRAAERGYPQFGQPTPLPDGDGQERRRRPYRR